MEDSGANEDRFIAGVYNYCERLCERCRFEDRCMVRHTERESALRHLLDGEDPEDPEVAMGDVADSLAEAMRLLETMAAERGVDLANLPPAPPVRSMKPRMDSLSLRSDRWGQRLEGLLEEVASTMPGLAPGLTRQVEESPLGIEEAGARMVAELRAAREAYELLCHYRYFITVRMMRAVTGARRSRRRGGEYAVDDALGSAKLVAECLTKAEAYLWRLAEFHRPWQAQALPLAAEAQALREALGKRVPGYEAFVRPGFDEEPA